ncbi:rCG43481 [Rattus norvegicus]|uniref:RCG43481 n=1 Tax=Rattus norvegicus TaxID=10116 RepID=A6JID4_RAT|nr:rCG43481 [Rattus norvegicus]
MCGIRDLREPAITGARQHWGESLTCFHLTDLLWGWGGVPVAMVVSKMKKHRSYWTGQS